MMAIIHIVTSFQFFNLSSKIETVRGHNISLHTHSNMTSVLKVSPIDIAYELSEYKNKTISANGLMEIFDNVLQSKRCLVDKDNIDELIPDWKSFKRIIIEYEFQRRIPCIYIKVRAIRKSDGMSVGRIDGVENALHDRVQRLIICYEEVISDAYIQNLFDISLLHMFTQNDIEFEIKCLGEGSDS